MKAHAYKKKATKEVNKKLITCYDCQHAYLMQSSVVNPCVAECKFSQDRHVAKTIWVCPRFQLGIGKPEIHPMKKLK